MDGNTYKTVKIGTQVWMAENLRTTKYRDKSPIVDGNAVNAWSASSIADVGTYCDYLNLKTNGDIYGHLYNWYAVANTNPKKITPEGWHVPSEAEFETLIAYAGKNGALNPLELSRALKETGSINWDTNTYATNSSGFTALPGGIRSLNAYTFAGLKKFGVYWSTTEAPSDNGSRLFIGISSAEIENYDQRSGASVRCIKD